MNTYSAYLILGIAYFIGGGSLIAFAAFLYNGSSNIMPLSLNESGALVFDACLSVLFFIQHSLMVRRLFRRSLERLIPEAYYSAFYAIASGIVLLIVMVFWQRSDRMFMAFSGLGWIFRLTFLASLAGFAWSTRTLKFFDPFGVRQIINLLHGRKPGQIPFIVKGPYRWVRHPFYFFTLLMIWSCPNLTMDRLLFNALWTIWIFVGTLLEEQDLVADFGDSYIEYQRRVPMLIPYKIPARHFDNSQ